jgi:hypothetical protein
MGNHKMSKFRTLWLYCIFVSVSTLMVSHQEYCTDKVQLQTGARHHWHNYTKLSQRCTVHINDFKQLTTLWWRTSTLPQLHENSLKAIPSSKTKLQYRTHYKIPESNAYK